LEGPFWMDDGYQVFSNGVLVGEFGKFGKAQETPEVYLTLPEMFLLPERNDYSPDGGLQTQTFAFRVWMGSPGLLHVPQGGGLHYAPMLGGVRAIEVQNLLAWHELILE